MNSFVKILKVTLVLIVVTVSVIAVKIHWYKQEPKILQTTAPEPVTSASSSEYVNTHGAATSGSQIAQDVNRTTAGLLTVIDATAPEFTAYLFTPSENGPSGSFPLDSDSFPLPIVKFNAPKIFSIGKPWTQNGATLSLPDYPNALSLSFTRHLYDYAIASTSNVSDPSSVSLDEYAKEVSKENGLNTPKTVPSEKYHILRSRHRSQNDSDGDVGFYFIKLPNGGIVSVETGGDSQYLYDDDKSGMSTVDRIVASMIIE